MARLTRDEVPSDREGAYTRRLATVVKQKIQPMACGVSAGDFHLIRCHGERLDIGLIKNQSDQRGGVVRRNIRTQVNRASGAMDMMRDGGQAGCCVRCWPAGTLPTGEGSGSPQRENLVPVAHWRENARSHLQINRSAFQLAKLLDGRTKNVT